MHIKCELCGEKLTKEATYLVAFFSHTDEKGDCEEYHELCKSCWNQLLAFRDDLKVHG